MTGSGAHETVRRATRVDRNICEELVRMAAQESGLGAALDPGWFDDPERLVLVGSFDQAVVGLAIAHLEHRGASLAGVLDGCYVEPAARGVGVGEALLEEVVAWSESQGTALTEARARPGDRLSKRLLEAAGFTTRLLVLRRPSAGRRDSPPGP